MNFKTYKFQDRTVDFGLKNNYSIFGLKMGTGKSVVSLIVAEKTKSKTLIICPAYLRLKWKSEIDKFFPGRKITVFESDKEIYHLWDTDYCILSYEASKKAPILYEWADLVIYDEAHYLKSLSAGRSDFAHRYLYENSVPRCLLLTGTPIVNRVWEFWSLIAMCCYDPRIEESAFLERFPTYVEFANHFSFLNEKEINVKTKKGGFYKKKVPQWEGHKNIDELKSYIKNIYTSEDGAGELEMPKAITIPVPVDYSDRPELLAEFERFTATGDETGVASDIKAQAALATAPFTVSYVKNMLAQGEQVVVFTDHVDTCEYVAKELGVPAIHGGMDMNKRKILGDNFQAGKSQVIVATIGSFSTGIDLFSAHHMVFNDLPWTPGALEQAKYRILRIGQKFVCRFHMIFGSRQASIILEKLEQKQKTIDAIFS